MASRRARIVKASSIARYRKYGTTTPGASRTGNWPSLQEAIGRHWYLGNVGDTTAEERERIAKARARNIKLWEEFGARLAKDAADYALPGAGYTKVGRDCDQ